MTLKELREQRAKAGDEIRTLAKKNTEKAAEDWTGEDEERWDKVNTDFDDLTKKIAKLERSDEIAKDLGEQKEARAEVDHAIAKATQTPEVTEETRAAAFRAWAMVGSSTGPDDEARNAAKQLGVNIGNASLTIPLFTDYRGLRDEYRKRGHLREHEARAQSVGTTTAGGFLRPEGFVSAIELSMLAFGGMREVSTIIRTASGQVLPWPTANDTGNTGILLSENTQDSEQDVVFSEIQLDAYKYSSRIVRVSNELMQDNATQPNLPTMLGQMLGERLARVTNTDFTTGDGTNKPNGIVTAASSGKTAASATAVTANELVDLVHSVDPSYRNLPGAGWMFNDTTLRDIRKLTDGNTRYIWSDSGGLVGGIPNTLLTYPVTVNQDVATMASTSKSILFGALSKYLIREVQDVTLVRMNERFADYHQVAFVAFLRTDGEMLDAGTDPVKFITQAA